MNQNTTPEKKCCPACEGFDSKGEESWTYCQKNFVGCCHTTQEACICGGEITGDATHSPEHCKQNNDIPSIKGAVEHTTQEEVWEREFETRFTYPKGHTMHEILKSGINREELQAFIRRTRQQAIAEDRKALVEKIEGMEWECPEHGKEFRVTPPLCEECNQCLEVNIVLASVSKLLTSQDDK